MDKVEVVSDLVDLTAASDDDGDEADLKKKEKKARKEQKRKEKERKREELKKAQAAQAKAARDERLLKEAQELSRRLADAAALRAAARREGYDRGVPPGTSAAIEIDEDEPEAAPPPEEEPEPAAKRARAAVADGRESLGFQRWEPPETPGGAQAAPQAAPPQLPSPRGPAAEAVERPRPAQEPAGEGRQKAAAAGRKGLGPSMAEVIAAASREQSSSGFAGFASFEGFDAKVSHEKAHGLETEEPDPDDEEDEENPEGFLPMEFYSLQDLPEELILADMASEPGLYVAHYIRYVLGAWQRMLVSGKAVDGSGLTNQTAALFKSKEKFQSTAEALKPLLRQLRSRKINDEMLSGLETVVKLAAEREYNHANSVYVGMTMGRKTWHNSLPCFQQQQNHGGSVRKIIKQSELVDFDWDPVVQAYMHALKRVIQFAQCIRPPDDPAKCA